MDRQQLDSLTRRFLLATFDQIEDRLALDGWEPAGREAHASDLVDSGHDLAGALERGDYSPVMAAAEALAPEATPEALRKLARRLLEVKLEAITAEIAAFNGEPLRLPANSPGGAVIAPVTADPKPTPLLSAMVSDYCAERVREGDWSPKTELQARNVFAVLLDLAGDKPLGDFTREDIHALGADVVALPSNMSKKFRGKTPKEVLQKLEGDQRTERLQPRSVNKYRQLLRSLFLWAEKNGRIASNPASVLGDVRESKGRGDRKPFTDGDLRTYFAALPDAPRERPFLYWIPRILAYSGLRLGECAQLRKEDVRLEDGFHVFDVNANAGKELKNEASIRLVPIHPRLVELGFLRFVEESPEGFLWAPEVRTTTNPQRSPFDRLSKLLGRILRRAGVDDPKKTGAHSFRHTVATRLKAHSVPDYQIADLGGHDDDSMTTGRYGKATSVATLSKVVALIELPV